MWFRWGREGRVTADRQLWQNSPLKGWLLTSQTEGQRLTHPAWGLKLRRTQWLLTGSRAGVAWPSGIPHRLVGMLPAVLLDHLGVEDVSCWKPMIFPLGHSPSADDVAESTNVTSSGGPLGWRWETQRRCLWGSGDKEVWLNDNSWFTRASPSLLLDRKRWRGAPSRHRTGTGWTVDDVSTLRDWE